MSSTDNEKILKELAKLLGVNNYDYSPSERKIKDLSGDDEKIIKKKEYLKYSQEELNLEKELIEQKNKKKELDDANLRVSEMENKIRAELVVLEEKLQQARSNGNAEQMIELDQQMQQRKEAFEQEKKLLAEKEKAYDESFKNIKKINDKLFKKNKEAIIEKLFPQTSKSMKGLKDQSKSLKNLGSRLEVFGKKTKVPGLGKLSGGLGKLAGGAGKLLGKIGPGPLLIAQFTKALFDMALNVNNASKELGRATGYGDVFNQQLLGIQKNANMSGIGVKEASEAIGAMANGLSSFNPRADETNIYLGQTIAKLSKLGVSSGESVKAIENLQRTFGKSAKTAADMTAQIARMGKEIGITGTKAINDFNSAQNRLVLYGKNSIKVFKELQAVSKAAGIEMGTLIGISEKFDTFEGAAQSAAQLNAIIGSNLSMVEMMSAQNDAQRIMMLKQQVQASVGNFEALDMYEKKAIAAAMGIQSVAEAQKLMNMSMAEYQGYVNGQRKQADIQQEIASATEKLVPLMDQLKLIGTEMMLAFSPLIEIFTVTIKFLNPIIKLLSSILGLVVNFVSPINALMAGWSAITGQGDSLKSYADSVQHVRNAFDSLRHTLTVKNSPALWEMPSVQQKAYDGMGKSMVVATKKIDKTKDSLRGVHDEYHRGQNRTSGFLYPEKMQPKSTDSMAMASASKPSINVNVSQDQKPAKIENKVYIGNKELRDIISSESKTVFAGIG